MLAKSSFSRLVSSCAIATACLSFSSFAFANNGWITFLNASATNITVPANDPSCGNFDNDPNGQCLGFNNPNRGNFHYGLPGDGTNAPSLENNAITFSMTPGESSVVELTHSNAESANALFRSSLAYNVQIHPVLSCIVNLCTLTAMDCGPIITPTSANPNPKYPQNSCCPASNLTQIAACAPGTVAYGVDAMFGWVIFK